MEKNKIVHLSIIGIFVSLYFLVATISMINSVAFFDLSHHGLMNWALAIGFELGAAASLAAIIILDKTNKTMVWGLFILLTSFQMMANSYHAFVNLEDYMGWIELFGLEEEEPIFQKRVLSVVSGAVLPLVALGFIKSLTDYLRPEEKLPKAVVEPAITNEGQNEVQEEKPTFTEEAVAAKVNEATVGHIEIQPQTIDSSPPVEKSEPKVADMDNRPAIKRPFVKKKYSPDNND
tara:strand:+ start:6239 stop:6940 length:702 start_codon:yes stop_codon:yes gene_type:complete